MNTILALMLLFLVNVSAAPTRKAECQDQYRHCAEWSKAGYCAKTGYKTYMTLMCAYSCNACKDLKQRKESEGEDVASASGLQDAQLDNPTAIQETNERDEDEASANEPISGEGEIHGDSDGNENKGKINQVDKLQNEESEDAALESQNKVKHSTERKERQSISEDNKDNQDLTSKQTQDRNVAATQDRDPPGVHLLKFQDKNVNDDVNPRSKISTRPKEKPSVNYKPLKETKVQNKEITEKQDEDVSASGSSTLDASGEGDASETSNPRASDKTTETKTTPEEFEEMKDIAGDIKTGSKIFEADISEPDSTSGCSSGFGCFSGNGEEIQTEKNEEAVELEPRSKIAMAPQVMDAKKQQADKNVETVQMSIVRESASGSDTVVQDDIQNNGEDEAPKSDDIAGAKSVANSNPKITTKGSEKSEENLKATKSVEEDEKISSEKASSGSGTDVNDDIQGQSVHGDNDNDEKIDGGKPEANSDALSGSGADTTLKSESPKEDENAAKSDEASKIVNEQKESIQRTTAKSEPVDDDKDVAKGNAKSVEMNGQMKNAAATSISVQTQSAAKIDDDIEGLNTEKEVMKDKNDKVQLTNESETKSDKGNKEAEKQQQEDKIAKSEPTNEDQSATKNDANSEEVEGQKDVKDTAETKPDESRKDDKENKETHGQKDVKEAVAPNDSQSGKESEEPEGNNDSSSGSATASIDINQSIDADTNGEPGIDATKSKTKSKTANTHPTDKEENDMEDALYEDMKNENKESGSGSGQPERDNNEDLSSPTARQRITSMEQLIKDDKSKAENAKDFPAKTRENVPLAEETPNDFINTDLGKGQKVRLILDQHYYKPYSNEDSMAYEMLALDLKKEVERAVGNQAIVSQISFSEIRKPGKLPRYSRVLATFMLHGDMNALHGAVRKGLVGDLTVDKKFFRSS